MRTTTTRGGPRIIGDQAYTKLVANVIESSSNGIISIAGNYFQASNVAVKFSTPMGLERWARFYHNFTILGTKITVTPVWQNAANAPPMQYGIVAWPPGDTRTPPSVRELAEYPYSRWTIYRGPFQSRGQSLSMFMSTNKIFGQKPPFARIEQNASGEFTGADADQYGIQTPADNWHYWLRFADIEDGEFPTEIASGLRFYVRIKYYIRFYNRRSEQFIIPT